MLVLVSIRMWGTDKVEEMQISLQGPNIPKEAKRSRGASLVKNRRS